METFVYQTVSTRVNAADVVVQNASCYSRALGRDAIRDLIVRARNGELPKMEW